MRSPNSGWLWLVRKEWTELVRSRAWWIFLLLIGPLVGVAFINAVRTYGELSGVGGTAAGVGEAFTPLLGIWAPTFSACEIAATFLLPFVAIRAVSADKQSGALKLELQRPIPPIARIGAKIVALTAGWLVAMLAPISAVGLWKSYGGDIHAPELLTVFGGHLLNAVLIIGIAVAAASIVEHPATAAILALAITVGTWIISFVAAVNGGVWERLSAYTPTAIVAEFQHGLVRLNAVAILLTLTLCGIVIAAIWVRIGTSVHRRTSESLVLALIALTVVYGESRLFPTWDFSESHLNSFSRAEEQALHKIDSPLRIEAHLAATDPRRFDLEHRVLTKLRRIMPELRVEYIAATSVGLFEQSDPHYGEIHYQLNGREEMNRATAPESVLETIFTLSGSSPGADATEDIFRGHPLAARPTGAALLFYGIWPAAVLTVGFLTHRRKSYA